MAPVNHVKISCPRIKVGLHDVHVGKFYMQLFFNYIDAVYSEDLTTHTDGTVTKIPYFTLMKRIFDERDDKQDLLSEQLEEVKRR